jgi:hypothetical protein
MQYCKAYVELANMQHPVGISSGCWWLSYKSRSVWDFLNRVATTLLFVLDYSTSFICMIKEFVADQVGITSFFVECVWCVRSCVLACRSSASLLSSVSVTSILESSCVFMFVISDMLLPIQKCEDNIYVNDKWRELDSHWINDNLFAIIDWLFYMYYLVRNL